MLVHIHSHPLLSGDVYPESCKVKDVQIIRDARTGKSKAAISSVACSARLNLSHVLVVRVVNFKELSPYPTEKMQVWISKNLPKHSRIDGSAAGWVAKPSPIPMAQPDDFKIFEIQKRSASVNLGTLANIHECSIILSLG